MPDSKRISHILIKEFAEKVLAAIGADIEQSSIFLDGLLWSDLIGRPNHGVWRLPAYVRRIDAGNLKCPCAPVFLNGDKKAVDVLDGDAGIGHFVGHTAMSHAIARAREHGIGAVGVRNSNHFGTGAWYVQLAARENMIGLALSNSIAKVAPHGGAKAVFGTNPFAFAAPGRDGKSLLLDMSTAAISGSEVMRRAQSGRPLPPDVAVDAAGKPIVDPTAIGDGALLPFGGARGSGIAMMVEILCSVLCGAMFSTRVNSMFKADSGPGGNGHFFLAINIADFIDFDDFMSRMEVLGRQIRLAGNTAGDVLIPGERRWQEYSRNLTRGIELDAVTISALDALADEFGVPRLMHADEDLVREDCVNV